MRKNFGSKTYAYPQPVFMIASYDENGVPDVMNAAWGGISGYHSITMCVDASHKTTENVLKTGAFTVSLATADYIAACDYVGIVSANDVPDKFARAGFHAIKSEFVNAPIIEELPLAIECRLISYDHETEAMVGEIINVSADESILDEKGKIDPAKLNPIIFETVHNSYHLMGPRVGNAFKDGLALK